ncbi:hypothetical protein LDENG_00282520 [Lucifuga dentata]|nr:hypothetical protein LDENG_00282520 [Lucifuga dentata]
MERLLFPVLQGMVVKALPVQGRGEEPRLEPPKLHSSGGGGGGGGGGRNALLAAIQSGTKLRKVTQVNDRSAPDIHKPKTSTADASNSGSQSSSGGMAPMAPSLGGLFAGGFPTLRPIGHRDTVGKTPVTRSSSSASLKPLWNPPTSADTSVSELHRTPLGPPPPPPPPPLPASFTPTCPSTLPPPPPKVAPVPSPAMRSLPPSYPCNAPTRRPPAIPRSASANRLAPPPAPPARSPSTELSSRIPPPPPPPLPPSSLRNGHLHSLDDFESKFQFHPVEDLPPPDEFKPFPRIYPSKENRVNPRPPAIRTHLR